MKRIAMTITQKINKLIAEFVGLKLSPMPSVVNPKIVEAEIWMGKFFDENPHLVNYYSCVYFPRTDELKFNSSFDWLMPVVEKIERIFNDDYIHSTIKDNQADLRSSNGNFSFRSSKSCVNKFTAVLDVVMQFVEWYNQNKK